MREIKRVLLLLGILALISALAFGQAETGQITGTITDPSGAAVPGATVTVKSVTSGTTRTATTNATGNYSITNLRPDQYDVTVTAPNFQTQTRRLNVTVGSRNEMSAALAVAGSSTTVEVTAESGVAQVETQSSELSQVVGSQQVSSLPSLTRNPYDFVQTAGNVATEPAAFQNGARGAGVNINGSRSASTNILLDGGENVNLFTASVAQTVPLDSVQEFRVITNDFSAEYGRASGGIVNVATKAGTNDLHGSLYEYNRVSKLASNTADNNANGVPKSTFTRNQFGYSVGGPIKKDKVFFFNNTEWTRVRSATNLLNYIIDPGMLALAAPSTQSVFSTYGKLDPKTKVLNTLTAASQCPGGPTLSDGSANPNCISPFLFANVPGATPVLDLVQFTTNADAGAGLPQNTWNTVGRVDFNLTDKTTLYGRAVILHDEFFPGTINNSPYAGYNTGETDLNQNYMINLTHIFSSAVVSQSKVIYNRLNQQQPLGAVPASPTYFLAGGAPNVNGQTLVLPGYAATTPGLAIPFGGPQNVTEAIQDLSWTKGRHQFRFGGQFVYTQDNRVFGAYEEAAAYYNLSGNTDAGFANLLSGGLDRFQVAINPQGKFPCLRDLTFTLVPGPDCEVAPPIGPPKFDRSNRYRDGAAYVQDNFKATGRLNLNLGLRWEYYGVQHNKDPKLDSNFYFGPGSNFFDQIRNGQVLIAPDSPVGGLWQKRFRNFAPRVGFAWDIFGNGKTALRGGYGIAYERNFGNVTFNVIQNPPAYAVVFLGSAASPLTPVPTDNFSPFNAGGVAAVPIRPPSLRAVDPHIKPAYTQMWNLSLQQEVARNTVVALEYSGSRGVHLYDIASINQTGTGCTYLGDCTNPIVVAAAAYPGGAEFNRLNTQYTNINFRGSRGNSWYNGLNVRFQTANLRNSGVELTANYTYSHAIDTLSSTFSEENQNNNLGYLDPFNPALDKGSADFDIRHRFVVSAVWDLPIFRDQKGALGKVVGGWQLAPIFTAQTGYPLTVYDCSLSAGDATCPRYIAPVGGNVPIEGHTPSASAANQVAPNTYNYMTLPASPLFPNAYLQAANGFPAGFMTSFASQLVGNSSVPDCTGLFGQGCSWPATMVGRNSFKQPGLWHLDFGIYKNFKVTERTSLQFRGEFYNLFNHSNFYVLTGGPFNNGGAADVSPAYTLDPTTLVPIASAPYTVPGKRGSTAQSQGSLGERRFVQLAIRLNF